MPRIPEILPSVVASPAGAPRFTASPVAPARDARPDALQDLGSAMTRAGQGLLDVGSERQELVDRARVKEMDALLADSMRKTLADPQGGYLNRVGKDAIDSRGATYEALRKARVELGGKLDNPLQRQLFADAADARIMMAMQDIDEHASRQGRAFMMAQAKARVAALQRDAVAYFSGADDGRDAMRREVALEEADDLAEMLGFERGSPAALQIRQGTAAEVHAGIVQKLLASGSPDRARQYLAAVPRTDLDPDTATRLQRDVEHDMVRDRSLRLSQEIATQVQGTPSDPRTGAQMLADGEAALVKLFQGGHVSAAVLDATLSRLQQQAVVHDRREADRITNVMVAAESILAESPMLGIRNLPAPIYSALQAAGKLGEIANFAEHGRYSTDPEAFVEAEQLPDAALRQMDRAQLERSFRGRLSPRDMDALRARHERAQQPGKPFEKLSVLSNKERVTRTARKLGILPPAGEKPSASQLQRFEAFEDQFDQMLLTRQQGLGRKVADEEVQGLLDEMIVDTVEVMTERSFLERAFALELLPSSHGYPFRQVPRMALQPGDRITFEQSSVQTVGGRVFLHEVPRDEITRIANVLIEAGIQPTTQEVIDNWVRQGRPGARKPEVPVVPEPTPEPEPEPVDPIDAAGGAMSPGALDMPGASAARKQQSVEAVIEQAKIDAERNRQEKIRKRILKKHGGSATEVRFDTTKRNDE